MRQGHRSSAADEMAGTDITVLCRTPVFPVNGRNPAPTAIIVSREAVERQRAPFSQAINAADSAATLHHLFTIALFATQNGGCGSKRH